MNHEGITHNSKTLQATTPMAGRLLQRKCACGQHTPGGGQCAECGDKEKLNQPLQAKLQIGGVYDSYEQEADRVAEQVLRTPGLMDALRSAAHRAQPLALQSYHPVYWRFVFALRVWPEDMHRHH